MTSLHSREGNAANKTRRGGNETAQAFYEMGHVSNLASTQAVRERMSSAIVPGGAIVEIASLRYPYQCGKNSAQIFW